MVAASIEAERAVSGGGAAGPASLLPWPTRPALAPAQLTAVGSLARFYRLGLAEAPRLCAADVTESAGLIDTLALLAAVEVAGKCGCRRVVWPVQFASDHDTLPGQLERIAAAIDRALLVSRLSLLDGPDEIAIETPLVDLTDGQAADLVVDLDAPAYLCWWWRRLSEPNAEAEAAPERRRWLTALREAGWVQGSPEARVSATAAPATRAD